ncbi:MAG: DUF6387 family protein [Pseudomonas sp.]
MARAKIPEWFDLSNYNSPENADEWGANIELRSRFLETKDRLSIDKQRAFFEIFAGRSIENFNLGDRHTNPFPVRTMNAADMAVISASWSVDQGWQELYQKVCSVVGQPGHWELLDEIIAIYQKEESLKNDAIGKVGWLAPEFCHGIPITVDLDSDDETLKLSFSIWLAGARDEINNRFKRSFNDEDFQKWHKFKILAAFDLYQWAEINGVRLTNTQIANALFPPESVSMEDRDIDMGERLRKVIKPLMEQTITGCTVRLITATVRLEKFLGKIVAQENEKRAVKNLESNVVAVIPEQ